MTTKIEYFVKPRRIGFIAACDSFELGDVWSDGETGREDSEHWECDYTDKVFQTREQAASWLREEFIREHGDLEVVAEQAIEPLRCDSENAAPTVTKIDNTCAGNAPFPDREKDETYEALGDLREKFWHLLPPERQDYWLPQVAASPACVVLMLNEIIEQRKIMPDATPDYEKILNDFFEANKALNELCSRGVISLLERDKLKRDTIDNSRRQMGLGASVVETGDNHV